MLKKILRLFLFTFLVFLSLIIILTGLAATETGSQWFVNWLLKRNDTAVSYESMQGRLLDKFSFHNVQYQDGSGNAVDLGRLEIDWSATGLSDLELDIQELNVFDLVYRATENEDTDEPFELPELEIPELPLAITVEKFYLSNVRLETEEEPIIEKLQAKLESNESGLSLQIQQLTSDEQQLQGQVFIPSDKNSELNLELDWSGIIEQEAANGTLEIKGVKKNLDIQLLVNSVVDIKTEGTIDLANKPYAAELNGTLSGTLLETFSEQLSLTSPLMFEFNGDMNQLSGSINGEASLTSGEGFDINLDLEAVLPGALHKALNAHVDWQTRPKLEKHAFLVMKGQGDVEYLNQVLNIDHQLQHSSIVNLSATVDLPDESIDLIMNWDDLNIPVSKTERLNFESGQIKSKGKFDALSIFLQTEYLIQPFKNNQQELPDSGNKTSSLQLEGEVNLLASHPQGHLSGILQTTVPEVLDHIIAELDTVNVRLDSNENVAELKLTSKARANTGEAYDIQLSGKLDLLPEKEKQSGLFLWSLTPDKQTESVQTISGEGRLHYESDTFFITHESKAPYVSSLKGELKVMDDDSYIKFDMNWHDLLLPLDDELLLVAEQGELHMEGLLSSLNMNSKGRFNISSFGPVTMDMKANWTDSVLTINKLNSTLLEGQIELNGAANFSDTSDGKFQLQAKGLNVGKLNPDLDSEINLSSEFVFTEVAEELSGILTVSSISGQWRNFPLKGRAQLVYEKDTSRIEYLHLQSGKNEVDAKLTLAPILNGFVDLDIQDMSVFSSDLAGEMKGRLDIAGDSDTPKVDGKINGSNIYMNDLRIASFVADTSIDLRPKQHSSVVLNISSLRYEDMKFDDVSIAGDGLTESHVIEINAKGEGVLLVSSLNGGLQNKIWSGQVSQLEFMQTEFGKWNLQNPAKLIWQTQQQIINLEKACLLKNNANVCVTNTGKADNSTLTNLELSSLPLAMANPFLPETMSLKGEVSGDVKINSINRQWQLESELVAAATQLGIGFADETEWLDIETASLTISANQNQRDVLLKLASPDYFDLSLVGSVENGGNNPLQADMDLILKNINWLEKIEPALTGSHGHFQTKINAGGSLEQPHIEGDFALNNGQINFLTSGSSFDQLQGSIRSGENKNQVLIDSFVASQGKKLEIKGYAGLSSDNKYPYELMLSGDNFPLVRTADISMDVSPDLNLSGTSELHMVKGRLQIPLLEVIVSSVPEGAVSVSPDTVIIQSKQPEASHVQDGGDESDFITHHLDVDVDVLLKPEIHIQGFGLDTRLAGDINVTKPVGVNQPRGEGQVLISEGSYRAYGQNLKIEQGRLQFGGALDNPGLNVRAFRPGLPVKAGVIVSGNVRQPKLTLFSEPTQTEADTLAYLITGRPLAGASGGEASLIAQAALSLGAEESSVLTNQIESLFNLDEVSVGTGDTFESTSLSASKRLSPKLTFSSSFNPFDQLWSFLLNYKLTDNWSVQTESGTTQGADVVYSIESNTFKDMYERFWELLTF